jgi:regulator of sigma E protease
VDRFEDFEKELILNESKKITVLRGDSSVNLAVKPGFITKLIKSRKPGLIEPRVPCIVESTQKGSSAEKAGLLPKDKIVGINGAPVNYFDEAKDIIQANKEKPLKLSVERNGQVIEKAVTVSAEGLVGFRPDFKLSNYFQTEKTEYNFFSAIPAGIKMSFQTLGKYFKGIRMIFTSDEVKAKDSLGGFYSMGRIFPTTFDWQSFWSITAMISVILAFMNILPIPMLDGGYVLFLLVEMVIGKPVNEKIQYYAQMAGMAFILFLLVYANGLDVFRAFGN